MPITMPSEMSLIPAKAVAEMLGVNERTIHRLKSAQKLPTPVRFGGNVRWKRGDIEAWIDAGCPGGAE